MRVVIVGAGKLGYTIAELLSNEQMSVTVIDREESQLTAVKNNLPQSELPSTLYIISDMEFDYCTENADMTNFDYAKRIFTEKGYKLPQVVFWNVDSLSRQQPVTMNEQGVALVSGVSPRIFSMIKSHNLSPLAYMLEILNSERYAVIKA